MDGYLVKLTTYQTIITSKSKFGRIVVKMRSIVLEDTVDHPEYLMPVCFKEGALMKPGTLVPPSSSFQPLYPRRGWLLPPLFRSAPFYRVEQKKKLRESFCQTAASHRRPRQADA